MHGAVTCIIEIDRMRLGALRPMRRRGKNRCLMIIEIDRMRLGALRPVVQAKIEADADVMIEIDRMRLGALRHRTIARCLHGNIALK